MVSMEKSAPSTKVGKDASVNQSVNEVHGVSFVETWGVKCEGRCHCYRLMELQLHLTKGSAALACKLTKWDLCPDIPRACCRPPATLNSVPVRCLLDTCPQENASTSFNYCTPRQQLILLPRCQFRLKFRMLKLIRFLSLSSPTRFSRSEIVTGVEKRFPQRPTRG